MIVMCYPTKLHNLHTCSKQNAVVSSCAMTYTGRHMQDIPAPVPESRMWSVDSLEKSPTPHIPSRCSIITRSTAVESKL